MLNSRRLGVLGLLTVLVGTTAMAVHLGAFEPITGARKDNFGDIAWSSSVDSKQAGRYSLEHVVENRDKNRNCRVNWDVASLKSVVLPEDDARSKLETTTKPQERNGTIRYSGGATPGEGESRALAWAGDTDSASVSSSAKLVVGDKTLYPVSVSASSSWKKREAGGFTITHEVRIKAAKLKRWPEDASREVGALLASHDVEWVSIRSKAWLGIDPSVFESGWIDKDGMMKFSESDSTASEFVFKARIDEQDRPILRSGALTFLDEKSNVLAQAMMPAFAVKPPSQIAIDLRQ